jgi:flagellar protein FliL
MAIDQTINEDDEREMAPPPGKGGVMRIILIVFSVLLLIVASVGTTLVMTGGIDEIIGGMRDGSAAEGDRKRASARPAAPIYVELGEPFVVNFIEGNQIRYLQVRIEVMTRDGAIPQAISTHLPKIRNNLVFMFSGFDYTSLATVAGKQKIRDEALAEIQGILTDEIGKPGVESVYFTSFVMQ